MDEFLTALRFIEGNDGGDGEPSIAISMVGAALIHIMPNAVPKSKTYGRIIADGAPTSTTGIVVEVMLLACRRRILPGMKVSPIGDKAAGHGQAMNRQRQPRGQFNPGSDVTGMVVPGEPVTGDGVDLAL